MIVTLFVGVCFMYIVINLCFDGLAGWRDLIPDFFLLFHSFSDSICTQMPHESSGDNW